MAKRDIDRRSALMTGSGFLMAQALAGLAGAGSVRAAPGAPATAFQAHDVYVRAKRLARQAYAPPGKIKLPAGAKALTYDQYRDIRFRGEKSLWRGISGMRHEVQFFPLGFYFKWPVEVHVVEDGKARAFEPGADLFSYGPLVSDPAAVPQGVSGFRIHGPINRPDYFDEYVVFQGASYFRSLGKDQTYGASARGLAINTAQPGGEEFPDFRAFWIEKPKPGQKRTTVHALLDSPSTTGAYRFTIAPGETTVMDVSAVLFPRRTLKHFGVAPLTSMYLHGPAHRRHNGDFRPAVHDNDGLSMINGKGEHLWRPLRNPKTLQSSAFVDEDPKGFGLYQRERNFKRYEDLEARYERRPSVWVEPKGKWGKGVVELIEIPTDEEIHDNIVAFWRPSEALTPGDGYAFKYLLHWGKDFATGPDGLRVAQTRVGEPANADGCLFVVDFAADELPADGKLPEADLTVSTGATENVVVQANPEVPGLRVSFQFKPDGAEISEMRLALKDEPGSSSERWLYRWTKS